MENEETKTDSKPNTIGELKSEYLNLSQAIVKQAKDNGRALLVSEAKVLRELALAMRHLDMIKAPEGERHRLIIIRPSRTMPGLQENEQLNDGQETA
jgi:hypothetical protein